MSIPLLDTFNIPTGILTSTTSELLLARDTDGDVKLFNGASYLRGSGTVNYLPVYSATNTLTSSILLQTGGNIGIGLTTNIDHKLKVGGGIYGDYLQVNTAYSNGNVPGRFSWDSDHDLIEVGLNTQFSAKLPQDEVWSCIAATTIIKGQLVYASGTSGSSGKIQATPFIANGTIPARFLIGVATENAAQGESFHAMRSGILRGVDTSMYTAGQDLWASITMTGGYQTNAPTAPNQKLSVAFVITSHAQVGELAIRINNGFELGGASDAQITSPTTNQLLRYNSNRWENWTHDFASVPISGTVNRLAKFTGDGRSLGDSVISEGNGNIGIGTTNPTSKLQIVDGNQLIKFATGTNTSGYELGVGVNDDGINFTNNSTERGFNFKNANGTLFTINSNGNVGINTANPSRRLDIVGGHTTSTFRVFYNGSDAPGAGTASIDIWASEPGQTYDGAGLGHNVNGHPFYGRRDTARGQSYIRFINGITSFHNNTGDAIGAERLRITASGNILTDGGTDTGEKLQVNGNAKITTMATGTSTDQVVTVTSSGLLNKRTVTSLLGDINGITGTGTINRLAKFTGDGRSLGDSIVSEVLGGIGINTTENLGLGAVGRGTIVVSGINDAILTLGVAGQFGAFLYTDVNSNTYLATRFGFLAFQLAGSERLRITASGNIGIGTTNPTSKLQIVDGNQLIKFATGTNTSGYELGVGVNDDGINFTNNSTARGFNFKNANGTLFTINPNGNVLINTATDTGHKLQVNGDIRQTSVTNNLVFANSSGVLTAYANTASIALGTGTGGFLTKYTGSGSTQNIGNSLLFESGSNIGLNKTNPAYNLDINGTLGVSNTLSVYSSTSASKLDITTNGNGVVSTYTNHAINSLGANFFVIGRSSIFTTGAGVGYKVQVDSGTTNGKGLFVNGDIYSTATITSFSDIRLKSELEIIENAIDKIKKISGYTYLFNDKKTLGLISQEVKNIAPEAIEEKGGYMTLNYQGFSAVIVEAIKELSSEIQKLKEKCQ